MSLFITFEGGEGCGKSTQTRLLYRRIHKLAIPVLLTHEPGVTELGEKITTLLKWSKNIAISPVSELLLFNASRSQLVTELIKPELDKGTIVICDRYTDSTIAYQSYARGLDLDMVKSVNKIATHGLTPDITFLLDIPVEKILERTHDRRPDRFEKENLNFHRRVRQSYLALAKAEPKRWVIIDGMQSKEVVAAVIWQKISKLLPE
jgi:dTMP kinase